MTEHDRQMSAALGRIPSGMFILTMKNGEAESGMLVSWVQQCAFDPPHITIVVKRGRPLSAWLVEGAEFTLNILDQSQTDMVAHFGRGFALTEPAFTGLDVERPEGEAPVLVEALAYLHCRVTGRYPVADHDLYVARIIAGRVLSDGQPMVHIRKSGSHY